MSASPQLHSPASRRRSALAVVLVLVSLAAAGLLVHPWLSGTPATGFGGNVQHADPGSVSAPGPLEVASLPPEEARAAGDPGARAPVRGPQTCGDLATRARVCSPSIGIDAALEPVGADGHLPGRARRLGRVDEDVGVLAELPQTVLGCHVQPLGQITGGHRGEDPDGVGHRAGDAAGDPPGENCGAQLVFAPGHSALIRRTASMNSTA